MADKPLSTDQYKDHLIELCKISDMCAAQNDYMRWYETLSVFYRNSIGFLDKYQKATENAYKKLTVEYNILKANMNRCYPNRCKVHKEFLEMINDFDLSLKSALIDLGILSSKSVSDKTKYQTKIKIPMGFNNG